MEIAWALPQGYTPTEELTADKLKEIAPIWAPYEVWPRVWHDNVITNDFDVARNLMSHGFDKQCNLWINDDFYVGLNRPDSVNTYTWSDSVEIENKEELLALQLASSRYDIILCVGWDIHSTAEYKPNTIEKHMRQNYLNYLTAIVKQSETQFVFIDLKGNNQHPGLTEQDNFSMDTLENTLELLKTL